MFQGLFWPRLAGGRPARRTCTAVVSHSRTGSYSLSSALRLQHLSHPKPFNYIQLSEPKRYQGTLEEMLALMHGPLLYWLMSPLHIWKGPSGWVDREQELTSNETTVLEDKHMGRKWQIQNLWKVHLSHISYVPALYYLLNVHSFSSYNALWSTVLVVLMRRFQEVKAFVQEHPAKCVTQWGLSPLIRLHAQCSLLHFPACAVPSHLAQCFQILMVFKVQLRQHLFHETSSDFHSQNSFLWIPLSHSLFSLQFFHNTYDILASFTVGVCLTSMAHCEHLYGGSPRTSACPHSDSSSIAYVQ